nr:MAG TPA: hypothetical protein [Caudoviricetes sp.]
MAPISVHQAMLKPLREPSMNTETVRTKLPPITAHH